MLLIQSLFRQRKCQRTWQIKVKTCHISWLSFAMLCWLRDLSHPNFSCKLWMSHVWVINYCPQNEWNFERLTAVILSNSHWRILRFAQHLPLNVIYLPSTTFLYHAFAHLLSLISLVTRFCYCLHTHFQRIMEYFLMDTFRVLPRTFRGIYQRHSTQYHVSQEIVTNKKRCHVKTYWHLHLISVHTSRCDLRQE